jgi:PKD repeat protein
MRKTKVWMLIILFISFLVVSCNKEPEGDPPVAGFTADKTAVATGESIQFTDNSTESPTSWSWDFGDGNNSTSQNPTHSYDTEGTYSVSLTATNEFGSDDVTMTDYITVTAAASEAEILISYLESTSSPYGKYYVNTDMPAIKSAEAVKTLMATNEEYIIDIRAAADYDTAHIEGAVNLAPADVLDHIQTTDLSNYTDIIIVCYTGQTAAWLTSLLRLAGIDNVYSMKWGMCSWHDDFASRWKNAVSNSAAALDFDQVAVDKGPEGDLPSLSTGFDTGADILEARLDVVLAEGFGAAAVSKSAVLDHKDDYYIVNYWPAAEYADPGHMIGARQYEPKQDIALDAALKTLPTDKTIVVYCYTGQNSANLAAYLRLVGYDAKSLTFGTNGMIYDLMTKSKWVDTEVKGYDYWYSPPAP